ncbi:hypothetical protein [Flammeovirga sp. SJP92]|uniref:hypothetical protein n=1 Tax=Flammeovirga sp. SJP92 TaxID=1775430 RepID=UPI000787C458|nr:hypothetical protein [Flammeovirga sp. SJP92]KXX70930.1 hypothetical protein AVL50_11200 [Flammeovirga sp. SJP92]
MYDKKTNKPLGLTNRHILNKQIGYSVIQPATKSRTSKYVIGNILRKGRSGKQNDFAVFEININNRQIDKENSIYGLTGKITDYVEPKEGMKVQKVGQRTGHTFGIIQKVKNNTVTIIPNPDKPTSNEISRGGDSGSLWVTDEEVNFKAVALHRAGEPDGHNYKDKAFAIPIKRVLNALQIKF